MPPPIALITGAGSGIGRATAQLLSNAGFSLALAGRRSEALNQTAATLTTPYLAIPTDLRDLSQVESMIDRTVAHFGRLDALINNAGDSLPATIPQTTRTLIEDVFTVNAMAPTLAIARAWPIFERQRHGTVVNLSSMATVDPFPTLYAYAAAKSAVNLLAQSVAQQGKSLGIKGFAVAPGAVETPLLRKIVGKDALPTSQTLAPESVAQVVADCVLGRRDADNGHVILIPSPTLE